MLLLRGVLAFVFDLLCFAYPGAALLLFFMSGSGALAVLFWIGAYAVTIGLFLVVVAFRLRRWVAQPIEQPHFKLLDQRTMGDKNFPVSRERQPQEWRVTLGELNTNGR